MLGWSAYVRARTLDVGALRYQQLRDAPGPVLKPKYRLRRWRPVPILPALFERKLTLCVALKASKQRNPLPNVSKSPQPAKCWAPTPADAICSPVKTRNVAAGSAQERSLTKPTPIASFKTSPSATDATVKF